MKKIIVLLMVFGLLFGCIDFGGEEQPPVTAEEENESGVTAVIEHEENITAGEEEEPEEEGPVETWQGIDYSEEPDAKLGVYFIDTCNYDNGDHGAAILIKKGDLDILVDTGSTYSGNKVVDFVKGKNVDDIDVLVSTTGDYRRYGGMDDILDEFEIEEFWWGGNYFEDEEYKEAVERASANAKNVQIVKRGHTVTLNGIEIEVLNPKTSEEFDDVNNDAIVLRIADRDLDLLLMGNVQTGAQGDLISNEADAIKVDVIEAPYYGVGAGTANIALFMQASKPKYAVIEGCSDETMEVEGSTRNPFKRVLDQYDVEYFETYENGTIRIIVDEGGYDVSPSN